MHFPIDAVRAQFPALSVTDHGRPRVYFDGPGGTQVCAAAIAAMAAHLSQGTANSGGTFATSVATDAMSEAAHAAVAELLGGRPEEIAFGPNMTTLTFAASRALAREWGEGDELVVTRLDHDANIAPWLAVAADRGMIVRWLDFDPADGRLKLDDLPGLLSDRTRLVAVGGASNALGTVNDLAGIVRLVRRHSSALVFVDAVQSAPHLPIDVADLGCDLLAFSPYKLFGPHAGVLWGRAPVMERLSAYKVRPAPERPVAVRLETGTPSFEAQAGVLATVGYLEWLGGLIDPAANGRRERLIAALRACDAYERDLGHALLTGLAGIPGLRLYGPRDMRGRVPTFSFTLAGRTPHEVAERLAAEGIQVWSGHFYAVEVIARLGLADSGGLIRVGLCHYNIMAEVERLLEALRSLP